MKSDRSQVSSSAPFSRKAGSSTGRNELLSKSLVVNSFRDVPMDGTSSRAKTKHLFDSIDIKEIIESSQKCSKKIRAPVVPRLEVPTAWAQSKDKKKRDFISHVIDRNKAKVGPNHYKIIDPLTFEDAMRPKNVHFPTYKTPRESVIVEAAKKL